LQHRMMPNHHKVHPIPDQLQYKTFPLTKFFFKTHLLMEIFIRHASYSLFIMFKLVKSS
jgi:hypothetical protein